MKKAIFFLVSAVSIVNAQGLTYLLNDGFESGNLSGWTTSGSIAISSSPVHAGTKAVKGTGGDISRWINLDTAKTYKLTAWVYLDASSTFPDWGGPLVDVLDQNWNTITYTPWLQDMVTRNTWTQIALTFKPTTSQVLIRLGGRGGTGNSVNISFDDVQLFVKPTTNAPPTASVSANPTAVSTLPGTVVFNSTYNDTDGAIEYFFWDFGDGEKSNLPNPAHTYIGNGTYTVKLTVVDDDGASASPTIQITVTDSTYPSLTINNPSQNGSNYSISGTGTNVSRVEWSTNRGLLGTATGTANWSFSLDLTGFGGQNRILVNGYDASGKVASREIVIDYRPTSKVNITGGVTQNTNSVEKWEKFESTFTIINSVASTPDLPYMTSGLPAGMPQGTGITVDGVFTSPSGKIYRQPAFRYQPYSRNSSTQQLLPTGSIVWKLRFAPNELGNWTYRIDITDGSGSTAITGSNLAFTAVTPTNPENHGFLRVSPADKRYFEFDDGTYFTGVAPGAFIGSPEMTDSDIALVGNAGANFTRTWIGPYNIGGSQGVPWNGALQSDSGDVNVAGTSLTPAQAYGDGLFSFTLPQPGNTGAPWNGKCAFWGWGSIYGGSRSATQPISVKPNTNYRVMLRLKTVGVTGTGGFTFRPGRDWPGSCNDYVGQPLVIPYQKGTQDWHTASGTWNSGSLTDISRSLMTLENYQAGAVYVDEISMREDLGNGQYGPEILPRAKFNLQNYFQQEASWALDYGLDEQAKRGMYQKLVIEEKNEYIFNHISPYGLAIDRWGMMQKVGGASQKYQEFYWRYLTARWSYSRAVHSWEYVNEDAPGSFAMANEMAKWFDTNDSRMPLTTTSFWCCIENGGNYYWKTLADPAIDYADSHVASNDGWLGGTNPYAPAVGGNQNLDSALYVYGYSMDVWKNNKAGPKPIVIGEAYVRNGNTLAGSNDTDTQGVWLHQEIWSQMNAGGMYFIHWDHATINTNNFYTKNGFYKTYRQFMNGIPLSNGKYQELVPTLPANVYGWGQIDKTNGAAHFWMYDKNYTWSTSPPGSGGTALGGKQVSLSGLPANTYTVEWWNTWTGAVTTENRNHSGGAMTLTVPSTFTNKDVAVKIYSNSGPTPTSTPTPIPGDANADGKVDGLDYVIWLTNYAAPAPIGPTDGDFNSDAKVDGLDYVIWLTNYS